MGIYIFEDFSNFENLPLGKNEWIFSKFLFSWWLEAIFFTKCLNFYHNWLQQIGKNLFFKYFWRILLTFEETFLEMHKHSWLSITRILKKLNSLQTIIEDIPFRKPFTFPFRAKVIEVIELSLSWTLFVFHLNSYLALFYILIYWESTVTVLISSYEYAILFPSWLADVIIETMQILFWNLPTGCISKRKKISRSFHIVEQKTTVFWKLEVILK